MRVADKIRVIIIRIVEWPVYRALEVPKYVFDAKVTNLSYVEPDLFRAEAKNLSMYLDAAFYNMASTGVCFKSRE